MMPKGSRGSRAAHPRLVSQFLIVLPRTRPLVWRRIQVPEAYSFWDLHVAVQDAMGWLDYHLHEFEVVDTRTQRMVRIGIPDDEFPEERPCLAGWKVPIARYLTYGSGPVRYRYDFGDDWEHVLEFEETLDADSGVYPRCLDGSGACPPEDVGGTQGYAQFLAAISDPGHPEHEDMLRWVGGRFDLNAFHRDAIVFDSPKKRWKLAFED
jgi:hypothetical protein